MLSNVYDTGTIYRKLFIILKSIYGIYSQYVIEVTGFLRNQYKPSVKSQVHESEEDDVQNVLQLSEQTSHGFAFPVIYMSKYLSSFAH